MSLIDFYLGAGTTIYGMHGGSLDQWYCALDQGCCIITAIAKNLDITVCELLQNGQRRFVIVEAFVDGHFDEYLDLHLEVPLFQTLLTMLKK